MIIDLAGATSISVQTDTDLIDATLQSESDPAWEFTDRAGHIHKWTKSGTLPTLDEVIDAYGWSDSGEEYVSASHYECKKCRDVVVPGWRSAPQNYVRGLQQSHLSATIPTTLQGDVFAAVSKGEEVVVRFGGMERKGYVTTANIDESGINIVVRMTS